MSNTISTPLCSVIVPVYNEEENLLVLHKEIAAALTHTGYLWDVLYIDDASTDGSLAVLRSLAKTDKRLHYLAFTQNKGQSAALAAGIAHAKGQTIITLDADLQNDPADIPAMLSAFYDKGVDMVIGWRKNRKDTAIKRLSSSVGNAVRNWWTKDTVHDTGCSLKIMRREVAQKMPFFKNMHRFLPALVKMQGGTVFEIPVNHRPRTHGQSKYGTLDRTFAGIYDLIGVRWLQNRAIQYEIKEKSKEEDCNP